MPLIALKLTLIPLSILTASLVSRRFGHSIGGVVAGLPLIAGPIVAILLIEQPPLPVAAITSATLQALPAALAFIAGYAWLSLRWRWLQCLAGATLAFLAVGLGLLALQPPPLAASALAVASPIIALLAMPRVPPLSGGVAVPNTEILVRMTVAVAVAALIVLGSERFPARISGLLLVWPITGSVLPGFTLPLYGSTATVNLLRGFANGLFGFVTFFAAISLLLPRLAATPYGSAVSFALAFGASIVAALVVHRVRSALSAREAASAPPREGAAAPPTLKTPDRPAS